MFADLKEEKQKEVLEAFGINSPEEANLDVVPIATITIEE